MNSIATALSATWLAALTIGLPIQEEPNANASPIGANRQPTHSRQGPRNHSNQPEAVPTPIEAADPGPQDAQAKPDPPPQTEAETETGEANQVSARVILEQSTYRPLEPIWARIELKNNRETPIRLNVDTNNSSLFRKTAITQDDKPVPNTAWYQKNVRFRYVSLRFPVRSRVPYPGEGPVPFEILDEYGYFEYYYPTTLGPGESATISMLVNLGWDLTVPGDYQLQARAPYLYPNEDGQTESGNAKAEPITITISEELPEPPLAP